MPDPHVIAQTLFAGVSAVASTIQAWRATRDPEIARATFDSNFEEARRASDTFNAAEWLVGAVPPDVVESLLGHAEECWNKYRRVLDNRDEYFEEDIDRATDAVKICVCRELNRVRSLGGSLPDNWQDQWDVYGCEDR